VTPSNTDATDAYVKALKRMKKSPKDRFGILGHLGVTGIGACAGAAASGTIAATAGVTTLAGSTMLGSVLGGVFVVTTPVGWVIGTAAAGAMLAYTAGRLIRGGAKADLRKRLTIEELEKRISELHRQGREADQREKKVAALITGLQYLVVNARISQERSTKVLAAVDIGELSVDDALDAIQDQVRCPAEAAAPTADLTR
jgi:hypothetical protein